MKKLILSVISILLVVSVFAQKEDYRKRSTLGVSFFLNDFKTAAEIKKNGLGSVIRAKNLFRTTRMDPGMAVSYLKGLSNHVDFAGSLDGSFVSYPIPNQVASSNKDFLLDATAGLNIKLLSDKYWVVPFADFGVGVSKYLSTYAAFVPIGVGLQINLFDEAFIIINSQYRIAVTDKAATYLYHSIGIAGNIGKDRKVEAPKEVIIPVVEVPKDRDGDGIVDSLDACPDQAGPASLNGCPDRDGDGIADKDDKCINQRGTAKYSGCPVPDSDKDGINDEEDKCPAVPGLARYGGCQIPDRDNDGVNDEVDKCPDVAGSAANGGCPALEQYNFNYKNVQFATGSSVLTVGAKAELDKLVTILSEHPQLKIAISGYTDNTGKAESNMVLSQKRADAVKTYLVSKGVSADKLTATGYGIANPVADNKTTQGRAQNRRVEFNAGQ